MLDLEPIFEFSRHNCIAICSFLVPANLTATVATLVLSVMGKSLFQIRLTAAISSILAITLFLHVSTWFIIGVITPITFILSGLGATCILVNILAIAYRDKLFYKQYLTYLNKGT